MFTKTLIVVGVVFACSAAGLAQNAKKSDGWIPMFEGESLTGWHRENGATWHVSKGVITGTGDDGWLCSEKTYTDYLAGS